MFFFVMLKQKLEGVDRDERAFHPGCRVYDVLKPISILGKRDPFLAR